MALPEVLTLAEFMAWEAKQEGKNEFEQGRIVPRIVAMAGGVFKHSRIGGNVVGSLFGRLHGSGCGAYNSDLLVLSEEVDSAFYPDASVVCGAPEVERYGTMQAVKNPVVVFEVLSPSTEARDRGFKLRAYASIPSMREVVLVDAGWRWEATVGLAASVRILDVELPLAEIYEGVDFEESLE